MNPPPHALIVGGGAAGFFAAITCAETNPGVRVTLLERSPHLLAKVRVSGGGRCNVTHDLTDPALFTRHYPRGAKALRGPLTRFGAPETVAWFAVRGVELKTEADGRMFPVSNSSETVVNCLLDAAKAAGVAIRTRSAVRLVSADEGHFTVTLKGGGALTADKLLLATGSNPQVYGWAEALGHRVEPPVPSLFTFNITDARLEGLAGISLSQVGLSLEGTGLEQRGPLLVTHWGVSGPAVLKLSAWGARELHSKDYRAGLVINWLPDLRPEAVRERLRDFRDAGARKTVAGGNPYGLPQRLWSALVRAVGVADKRWADLSKAELSRLLDELSRGRFEVTGKGVFKEEFVTCGGVRLDEVNFKTMESRVLPGLYFAGEVLDIDGVTGGFNFQSAWATGYLAGRAMAATGAAPTESGHRAQQPA
ncbi:MAG: HI0933-like protein [uncultured Truepera sp.]|uniref:HI0933-like protein n=1 Tax=uncultured Truepera sp. TaxID=543023 RepID=A0A6J4VT80_9DEIN|nr:MAG: HI0933-like protein [uncultured Truepera sp.]